MNKLEGFPTINCISLEESIARRELLSSQFSEYGLTPNYLLSKRYTECKDTVFGVSLHSVDEKVIACAVSHLKMIKKWYDTTDEEYGFFCEDDLSLETIPYWSFTFHNFMQQLPPDWEAVQLCVIRDSFVNVLPETAHIGSLRERHLDDWSVTAYILTKNYAKKLIDQYIFQLKDILYNLPPCCGEATAYKLEVNNWPLVQPLAEHIILLNTGKVYCCPLFIENISGPTTSSNEQSPNHIYSSNFIMDWWKKINKLKDLPTIHYISLEESTDRRNNLENWFKKYNITNYVPHLFKRFEEYDYNLVGPYVDRLASHSKGPITSHFTLLKELYETHNDEYFLIIEDDLSLETVQYWNFTWEEFFNNLPKDWNCIQLVLIREHLCNDYIFEKRKENDWCAAAYLIKREYIKLLLDLYYFDNFFNLDIENLELPPIIERLLFTNKSGVYCFPLFVEDCYNTYSSLQPENTYTELINGQGPMHHSSYDSVINWWENKGIFLNINEIFKKTHYITVVQIGANQGNDELTELLKGKHIEKLILVEPLDIHNDNLKQCYSNIKEVHIENIAIIDNPNQKEVSFYFHKEDRIEYGWGNHEISTLDKNHILKHGKTEEGIVEIKVPSMTINDLLDKYNLKNIDILFMDVEGFDHNILLSIDYNKYSIKDLYFENLHLIDRNQTEEFIKSKGFQIIDPAFGKWGWATHVKNDITA